MLYACYYMRNLHFRNIWIFGFDWEYKKCGNTSEALRNIADGDAVSPKSYFTPYLKVGLKLFGQGKISEDLDSRNNNNPHEGLGYKIDSPVIVSARSNSMKLKTLVLNVTGHKIAKIKAIKMSLDTMKKTWQLAFAPLAEKYFPQEYKQIADLEKATARSLEES